MKECRCDHCHILLHTLDRVTDVTQRYVASETPPIKVAYSIGLESECNRAIELCLLCSTRLKMQLDRLFEKKQLINFNGGDHETRF